MDMAQFIDQYAYACDQWGKEEHYIFLIEDGAAKSLKVVSATFLLVSFLREPLSN